MLCWKTNVVVLSSVIWVNSVYIFRDEGEDGEKKRDWKDEKKFEELSGDNKDEKDEDKGKEEKDKVGN